MREEKKRKGRECEPQNATQERKKRDWVRVEVERAEALAQRLELEVRFLLNEDKARARRSQFL